MSVACCAKLKGNVSPDAIAKFLEERFDVATNNMVKFRSDHFSDIHLFENFTGSPTFDTASGFIDMIFPDGSPTRSLFYAKSNLNFKDNYEYYEANYPELLEMVNSETTYISLGHNDQAEMIISEIVHHFGGWYCSNDCSEEYVKVEKDN